MADTISLPHPRHKHTANCRNKHDTDIHYITSLHHAAPSLARPPWSWCCSSPLPEDWCKLYQHHTSQLPALEGLSIGVVAGQLPWRMWAPCKTVYLAHTHFGSDLFHPSLQWWYVHCGRGLVHTIFRQAHLTCMHFCRAFLAGPVLDGGSVPCGRGPAPPC